MKNNFINQQQDAAIMVKASPNTEFIAVKTGQLLTCIGLLQA
jgi:hypothetical protein